MISFISCKGHKMKKKCCDTPPIQEIFKGGYLGMPNIFTPDNDGINDKLIIQQMGLSSFKLTIRNGMGTKVFETKNPDEQWDGKNKDKFIYGAFKYKLEAVTINGEKINKEGRICVFTSQTTCKSCNCIEDNNDCWYGDQFNDGVITYQYGEGKPFKCD